MSWLVRVKHALGLQPAEKRRMPEPCQQLKDREKDLSEKIAGAAETHKETATRFISTTLDQATRSEYGKRAVRRIINELSEQDHAMRTAQAAFELVRRNGN